MRVEATIKIAYEIPQQSLQDAYGTTDLTQIAELEEEYLGGEHGQADYLQAMLQDADVLSVEVSVS